MRCGDDIQALSRFANAQIVAFRKILKKYRVREHANVALTMMLTASRNGQVPPP